MHQRHKQSRKPNAQQASCQCPQRQHGAQRGGVQAITEATQQWVNQRIQQARAQQHRTQGAQRDTPLTGIQIGHQHIQRQCAKRQRQTQQAVAHTVAHAPLRRLGRCCRCRAGVHGVAPAKVLGLACASNARRICGSEVWGLSQIPKNCLAKAGSRTSPSKRPLLQNTAPLPG